MPDAPNSLAARLRGKSRDVEKAILVWDHYRQSRIASDLEPRWVHAAYDLIRQFLSGQATWDDVRALVQSHELPDGFRERDGRVMHDGWKVGTATWVFMGRAAPGAALALGGGWVAVRRTVPSGLPVRNEARPGWRECWIAYHVEQQMGYTALTANCYEALTLQDLKTALRETCSSCEGTGRVEGIGGREVECLHAPG